MKKLFIGAMIMLSVSLHSQDKRFTLSAYTEALDINTHNNKYDYGFNIGAQIEYQMTLMYFDVEIFYVPDLNNLKYFHWQATLLGFNYHFGGLDDDKWRLALGVVKLGAITRTETHSLFGSDLNLDYYFNSFYIGLTGKYDLREDDKEWGGEGHDTWSFGFRAGFTF